MPVRKFIYLPIMMAALVLSACTPASDERAVPVDPETARLQAIAERVTIIRDDFGVPHIYAKTDADAVFGMLYA